MRRISELIQISLQQVPFCSTFILPPVSVQENMGPASPSVTSIDMLSIQHTAWHYADPKCIVAISMIVPF